MSKPLCMRNAEESEAEGEERREEREEDRSLREGKERQRVREQNLTVWWLEDFHKEEELIFNFKLFLLLQPKSSSMNPKTLITSPAQLRFMGWQRVGHDWATELTDWLTHLSALERNLAESQENRIQFHGWIIEFLRVASRIETNERWDLRETQKSVGVRTYCQKWCREHNL